MSWRLTPRRRTLLVMLLATIYAVCYAAIEAGLALAPPLRFAGLRAAIAGATLLAALVVLRQPLLPARRLWPGIALIAAFGTSVAYGAMFLSPGRTGAGIASVLGNLAPLLVVGLAAVLLGEPVTGAKLRALALGLVGVSLIAYPAITGPARAGVLGAALPLIASTGRAFESVTVKRLRVGHDVVRVAGWQLLAGSVPLLLLSAWVEAGAAPIVWSRTFVALLLFLAVVGTAFTTSLWYWLVQGDEVGRLSLYLFLIPVLGLALAVAVFGERVSALELTGVALTLVGMWAVARDAAPAGPIAAAAAAAGRPQE